MSEFKYEVSVITENTGYSNEPYKTNVIESHSFSSESEAKKKKRELIKNYSMEKIGHTYMNKDTQEIRTNF